MNVTKWQARGSNVDIQVGSLPPLRTLSHLITLPLTRFTDGFLAIQSTGGDPGGREVVEERPDVHHGQRRQGMPLLSHHYSCDCNLSDKPPSLLSTKNARRNTVVKLIVTVIEEKGTMLGSSRGSTLRFAVVDSGGNSPPSTYSSTRPGHSSPHAHSTPFLPLHFDSQALTFLRTSCKRCSTCLHPSVCFSSKLKTMLSSKAWACTVCVNA